MGMNYRSGCVVVRQGLVVGWLVVVQNTPDGGSSTSSRLGEGLTVEQALLRAFARIDKKIRQSMNKYRAEEWKHHRRDLEHIAERLREEKVL